MTTATCIAPINISLETKKQGYVEIDYPKVSDLIKQFPSKVERWSYRQVSNFIMKLLCLPNPLEVDIRSFIISREINGAKLLTLNEIQLKKLGFNKLWCHSLSTAIQDLNEIVSPTITIPSISIDSSDTSPQDLCFPTFSQVVDDPPLVTERASASTSPKPVAPKKIEQEFYQAILENQNRIDEVKETSVESNSLLGSIFDSIFDRTDKPKKVDSLTSDNYDSIDWGKVAKHAITISAILATLGFLGSKAVSRK